MPRTRQLLVATFALAMVGTAAPAPVAAAGPDPAFPAATNQESVERAHLLDLVEVDIITG